MESKLPASHSSLQSDLSSQADSTRGEDRSRGEEHGEGRENKSKISTKYNLESYFAAELVTLYFIQVKEREHAEILCPGWKFLLFKR